MAKVLEICVDSLASARAAIAGGADRLELCSALVVGGLTPYEMLLRQIKEASDIPVRCLMRPRGGDFLYTSEEIHMLRQQILQLKRAGADGFVIGCLTAEGRLDSEAMKPLVEACGGRGITLHRCIDVSRDLEETYETAAALGIDTVLTSGGASSCLGGAEVIGRLLEKRDETDGPEVLIGAGVKAAVIRKFRQRFSGARAFHMSGKPGSKAPCASAGRACPWGCPDWTSGISSRPAWMRCGMPGWQWMNKHQRRTWDFLSPPFLKCKEILKLGKRLPKIACGRIRSRS